MLLKIPCIDQGAALGVHKRRRYFEFFVVLILSTPFFLAFMVKDTVLCCNFETRTCIRVYIVATNGWRDRSIVDSKREGGREGEWRCQRNANRIILLGREVRILPTGSSVRICFSRSAKRNNHDESLLFRSEALPMLRIFS